MGAARSETREIVASNPDWREIVPYRLVLGLPDAGAAREDQQTGGDDGPQDVATGATGTTGTGSAGLGGV